MTTRLKSAERLVKLQAQRVSQVETEIAALRIKMSELLSERTNLLSQIERSLGANQAIIDLLFRKLDALSRQEASLNAALLLAQSKLVDQKLREKAFERGLEATATQIQNDKDRRELGELLEIIVGRPSASFR